MLIIRKYILPVLLYDVEFGKDGFETTTVGADGCTDAVTVYVSNSGASQGDLLGTLLLHTTKQMETMIVNIIERDNNAINMLASM